MLLVTIRFLGIEFFFQEELEFPLYLAYVNSLPGGVLMGVLWVTVDAVLRKYFLFKARTFGIALVVMTFSFVLAIVVVIFLASLVMSNSLEYAISYSIGPIAIGNVLFSLIAAFLLVFLQNLDQRMGPGVLFKYLTGKYFKPREEERIFLFMDLKSSTSIAEKLGHASYSEFIQDCYRLLTKPIKETSAEVYQYVGDEVVLSWYSEGDGMGLNCLDFFFQYSAKLRDHHMAFEKRYGAVPIFKAAAHIGKVMVTEVGQIKTEIAFHGDVLNTTSRIQGYCNELSENLLITESLMSRLPKQAFYSFRSHGPISLKGKENHVKVFGVAEIAEESVGQ